MRPEARTAERPFARVMPSSARPAAARARRSARPTARRLTLLLPRLLLSHFNTLLVLVKAIAPRTRERLFDVTRWRRQRAHFSSTSTVMRESYPRRELQDLARSSCHCRLCAEPLSRHGKNLLRPISPVVPPPRAQLHPVLFGSAASTGTPSTASEWSRRARTASPVREGGRSRGGIDTSGRAIQTVSCPHLLLALASLR